MGNNSHLAIKATSLPTTSLPAEMTLLGSLILNPGSRCEALGYVDASYFGDGRAQTLFAVIRDLAGRGGDFDPSTIHAELVMRNQVDQAGGAMFLGECIDQCPNVLSPVEYAKTVSRIGAKRKLLRALKELYAEVATPESENPDPLALFERIIQAGKPFFDIGRLIHIRELIESFDVDLAKLDSMKELQTGIPDIDKAVALLKPSSYTVIAARPGVGKSTLLRQILMKAALKGPALLFTLEESPEQVRDKIIASFARVPYWRWYQGLTDPLERQRMLIATAELDKLGLYFWNDFFCDVAKVRLAVRTLIEKGEKPRVVFIDHLQLMKHPKSESREQAVGETSRLLRLLALDFDIPVVLMCQMNREIEHRGESEGPRLSDLRESGQIEANAANVIFLWKPDLETPDLVRFTLAKHRDGPTAQFDLLFLKDIGSFVQTTERGLR